MVPLLTIFSQSEMLQIQHLLRWSHSLPVASQEKRSPAIPTLIQINIVPLLIFTDGSDQIFLLTKIVWSIGKNFHSSSQISGLLTGISKYRMNLYLKQQMISAKRRGKHATMACYTFSESSWHADSQSMGKWATLLMAVMQMAKEQST